MRTIGREEEQTYKQTRVNTLACQPAAEVTRKTVLDQGSRSDRPRYSVTTPSRVRHWPL